ncbi:hypothetical protein [Asanoa siamensis]|uniref:Pyridoxamine 5'-phosphate oxidase n=1 Tax=Asanoa siamensis TaxID=926357 RepID=A0ABQ4CH88_9ACTN|nr:hypothetical protein [Asanoa siamensis]GIF70654.1 hypothetical protein Asi02nite_01720 [Asanoa siamensis]
MTEPVVEEAIRKAAIAWVSVDGGPAQGLWCVPVDGALYVVTGIGEQRLDGLARAATAEVTLRGDHGGRIVTWTADVRRVQPGDDEWNTVAPQVGAKRLNATGSTELLVERWAMDCTLSCLSPAGAVVARPDLPDGSLAEPPRETPAARPTRKPFRLHKVRRR